MMNCDQSVSVYRILDASANRAAEGLRTLEEYARFAIDDAAISGSLKSLRHALTSALTCISREQLLRARDTANDVGTELGTPQEYDRSTFGAVISAAANRVQQSLRCLEEYGKLISVNFASQIEAIRYQSYDVFATLELRNQYANRPQNLIAVAKLYVLMDTAGSEDLFVSRLKQCFEGGVDVLQLRDRSATDRTLFDRAGVASRLCRQNKTLFIVNDRADIAVASGADGVHVGQDELPVNMVRKIVGREMLVGLSTHSIEQARTAVTQGVDYIGVGPVFASSTKRFDSFVGTELLQQVAREITIPAFAIGGITSVNLPSVVESGIGRIAVTAAICDAPDITKAARGLKATLIAATSS